MSSAAANQPTSARTAPTHPRRRRSVISRTALAVALCAPTIAGAIAFGVGDVHMYTSWNASPEQAAAPAPVDSSAPRRRPSIQPSWFLDGGHR